MRILYRCLVWCESPSIWRWFHIINGEEETGVTGGKKPPMAGLPTGVTYNVPDELWTQSISLVTASILVTIILDVSAIYIYVWIYLNFVFYLSYQDIYFFLSLIPLIVCPSSFPGLYLAQSSFRFIGSEIWRIGSTTWQVSLSFMFPFLLASPALLEHLCDWPEEERMERNGKARIWRQKRRKRFVRSASVSPPLVWSASYRDPCLTRKCNYGQCLGLKKSLFLLLTDSEWCVPTVL